MGRTLLLTGRPGVGKTTVIKKVARALGETAGGFFTEEIRSSSGRRTGFRLVTLRGEEAVMAHVDLRKPRHPRVSRYGVDLGAVERVGVVALQGAMASGRIIIVDEIGKMELLSDAFKHTVLEAVESECTLLGTAMRGSDPWVDDLRARKHVQVWEVTSSNRDELSGQISRWLTR